MWTLGFAEGSPKALWLRPRLVEQPVPTFADPVASGFDRPGVHRHAIVCTPPVTPFRDPAHRARYTIYETQSGHDVMVSAPRPLAAVLDRLAQADV